MLYRLSFVSILALLIWTSTSELAQSQAGSSGLSFLKLGADARTIAMGEAGVAGAIGPASAHVNPALMGHESRPGISVMHNAWFQDITSNRLSASVPLWGMVVGGHVHLVQVPDIEIRTVPGEALGTFSSRDFSAGLTVGGNLGKGLHAGLTMKYLFEKIYVDVSDGYALDLGLTWKPVEEGPLSRLRTGIALTNLGSMSELRAASPVLPSALRYGASWLQSVEALDGTLAFTADGLSYLEEGNTHFAIGAELNYRSMVSARVGYQSGYETRALSFGIGAGYGALRCDYAFTPFSEGLGSAHTISLSLSL